MPGTDDDDEFSAGPPPSPEERTWVHPSELAGRGASNLPPPKRIRRRLIGFAAVAIAAGFAVVALVVNQAVTLEPHQSAVTTRYVDSTVVSSTSVVTTLVSNGAWLGVSGVDAEDGVLLTACDEGGPAREAGIRPDDLVTHVDGTPVATMDELALVMDHVAPDTTVSVAIVRDDAAVVVEVRPSAIPIG